MKMEMSGNKIMNPHRNGKQMEYFERRVRSWGLIALCALAIAVFFCFPFANGQLHQGADTGFHLNRIISLALARENGIRYPYLFCEQNYQFGYPTPIFYCNLFLSAPAALLQSGMPPVIVYKLLVVVLVWLAALSLGLCSEKVTRGCRNAAVLGMVMMILNTHSITDVLRRGGLGELLALVWIPLCLRGIYQTMYGDSRRWITLAAGYCGLVLSHNISFILMCFVFAAFALIRIRFLWRHKQRLWHMAEAVLAALACSLFFIAPMLEQLWTVEMVLSHTFNLEGGLASSAAGLSDLLNFRVDTGIYLNNSPGPFLLFLPLSGLLIRNKRKHHPFLFHCWVMGYATLLMMTRLFPWALFPFFSFMQFVQRLLPVCIVLLALSGSYYWTLFLRRFRTPVQHRHAWIISYAMILVPSALMLKINFDQIAGYPDSMTAKEAQLSVYGEIQQQATYNVQQLSSADYLPVPGHVNYKVYREWVKWAVSPSESIIDSSMQLPIFDRDVDESEYGHFRFIVNFAPAGQWLIVPRTYYTGYQVAAYQDGRQIATLVPYPAKETGLVQFDVLASESPVSYDVFYQPTPVQTMSMAVSRAAVKIVLVVYLIQRGWFYARALQKSSPASRLRLKK